MNSYKGSVGNALENWFKELFRDKFQFTNYVPSAGQIPLINLYENQQPGNHLELDGLILINRTCIVFEYSKQNDRPKNKIKKFTKNAHLFCNSPRTLREKFELFGIEDELLDEFEEVENWKYVFFGTSEQFESTSFKQSDFPDYPEIQKELYIFKPSQLDYLVQLNGLIGSYARNEFFAFLNLTPEDIGEGSDSLSTDCIKLSGKYITSDKKQKADIYLTKFKVRDLLQIARVSRYEGIPFILDGEDNQNYQRLLIQNKLNNIAKGFINNNKLMGFPNTLTLVLSNDCQENAEGRLVIPKKYSSVDVIDGQHRLFVSVRRTTPMISHQKTPATTHTADWPCGLGLTPA